MSVRKAPKSFKGHRRVNAFIEHPWWPGARRSRRLRKYLNSKGYITPNFTWEEMRCSDGTHVPKRLRKNAIRHCWNLERLRHKLHKEAKRRGRRFSGVSIDGPFRTHSKNVEVGGATDSRHLYADATDHFIGQVLRWQSETGLSRTEILRICDRIFSKGGVGNENSGTLHLDSRGWRARFVTW